jgi:3-phenylpropionate/trans-cinnamate dioxygenase ferredoxin subunit
VKLSELPDVGAVRVILEGTAVAVVRDENGDVHAIGDTCTHADVSLAEGEVDDCSIECWLHGSRFDLRTGAPTSLPAIRPVPVYAVTIDGDDVLVDVTTTSVPADDAVPTSHLVSTAQPVDATAAKES